MWVSVLPAALCSSSTAVSAVTTEVAVLTGPLRAAVASGHVRDRNLEAVSSPTTSSTSSEQLDEIQRRCRQTLRCRRLTTHKNRSGNFQRASNVKAQVRPEHPWRGIIRTSNQQCRTSTMDTTSRCLSMPMCKVLNEFVKFTLKRYEETLATSPSTTE